MSFICCTHLCWCAHGQLMWLRAPFFPPVELKDDKLCLCLFFFFNQTSFSKSQHLHVVLVICVSLWNTWQQWSSSSQPRAALLLHPLHECVYLKVEIILSRDEMVWNPQFGLSESPGVSNDARMSSCVCEAPIRLLLSARTLLNNSFETFWICQE